MDDHHHHHQDDLNHEEGMNRPSVHSPIRSYKAAAAAAKANTQQEEHEDLFFMKHACRGYACQQLMEEPTYFDGC